MRFAGRGNKQPAAPKAIVKLSPSRSRFFLPTRMRPLSSMVASSVPSKGFRTTLLTTLSSMP